jgi:hypothetical protein
VEQPNDLRFQASIETVVGFAIGFKSAPTDSCSVCRNHQCNLTIEHSTLDAKILDDPLRQILEVAECVALTGNEDTSAVFDVGQRPKAVDLQLEDVVVRVEEFGSGGEPKPSAKNCSKANLNLLTHRSSKPFGIIAKLSCLFGK